MGVIRAYSVNGLNPSTISVPGTTKTFFPDLPSLNLWNVGAAGINTNVSSNFKGVQPSLTSNQGGMQIPGNGELDGQMFSVTASGNVIFGVGEASTTAKVGIYLSTAAPTATPAYQTLFELTLTNQTLDNTAYPFSLSLDMQGDTASGVLQLASYGWMNGTYSAPAQQTALTGISFQNTPVVPAFVLVCGVTFGAANTGNTANLKQFQAYLA